MRERLCADGSVPGSATALRKSKWRIALLCLAVLVLFGTAYALILPAMTLEDTVPKQTTVTGTAAYEEEVTTTSGDKTSQVDYTFNIETTTGMKENGFTIATAFRMENLTDPTETPMKLNVYQHYIDAMALYGVDQSGNLTALVRGTDYTVWKDEVDPYQVFVSVNPSNASYPSYCLKSYGYLSLQPVNDNNTLEELLSGVANSEGESEYWKLVADAVVYEGQATDDNDTSTATKTSTLSQIGAKSVDLQKQTKYVTDLREVISGMKVLEGNTDVTNDTGFQLKTNTEYTFLFTFKESTNVGNVKQFSTEMSYLLPEELDFLSAETGEGPSGKLYDSDGYQIGTYEVVRETTGENAGRLKLAVHIDNTSEKGAAFLTQTNGEFSIAFTGQFSTKDNQQPTNVTIGEDMVVRVNLVEGSGLRVEKDSTCSKAVIAETRTENGVEKVYYSLTWKIQIKNYGAKVEKLEIFDTMYEAVNKKYLTYDTSSVVITKTPASYADDQTVQTLIKDTNYTVNTDTISADSANDANARTMTIVVDELDKGETLLITYKMDLDPSDVSDYSQYIRNYAVTSGINANSGDEIEKVGDDEAFTVTLEHLRKVADGVARNKDTGKTYVTWRINVNSYANNNLAGTELTDTIILSDDDGTTYDKHTFSWADSDTDSGYDQITVTITYPDGTTQEQTISPPEVNTDGTCTFTLPDTGTPYYSAKLVYYTKTETPTTVNKDVKNQIEGTIDQTEYESEDEISINPVVDFPKPQKTGEIIEVDGEEYVQYTIVATVPAGLKDRQLRMPDYLNMRSINVDEGYSVYTENDAEILSMSVTTKGDDPTTYTLMPWTTQDEKPSEYTYTLVKNLPGSLEYFELLFNCKYDTDNPDWSAYSTAEAASKWGIDEESVLTIVYRVPLSGTVFTKNSSGEIVKDYGTVAECLDVGWIQSNSITIASDLDAATTTEEVSREPGTVTKTAEQVEGVEGLYKYTVTLFNYDVSNAQPGENNYQTTEDDFYYTKQELIDLVFTDAYDENLELVENDSASPFEMTVLGYYWDNYYYAVNAPQSETITAKTSTQNGYVVDTTNHTITLDLYDEDYLTSNNGADGNIQIGVIQSNYWYHYYNNNKIDWEGKAIVPTSKNFSDYVNSYDLDSTSYVWSARFYCAAVQFTYYMQVTDEAKQSATVSTLEMPNTATIETATTGSTKDSGSDTATVTYDTEIMTKTAKQVTNSQNETTDEMDYEVEVNPSAVQLNGGNSLTMVDEIPSLLKLKVPDSSNMKSAVTVTKITPAAVSGSVADLLADSSASPTLPAVIRFTNKSDTKKTYSCTTDASGGYTISLLDAEYSVTVISADGTVYAGTDQTVTGSAEEDLADNLWSVYTDGNILKVTVPDETHVKIKFTCQVTNATIDQDISNSVYIEGKQDAINGDNTVAFLKATSTGQVTASTGEFYIQKTDVYGAALTGAEFELYTRTKPDQDISPPDGVDNTIVHNGVTYFWYGHYAVDEDGKARITTYTQYDSSTNTTSSHSLSNNSYYLLHESKVPDGYVRCADVEFVYRDGTKADSALGENIGVTYVYGGDTVTDPFAIVNSKGVRLLPGTGGSGTTMIYLIGSVFALGGTIILITKLRLRRSGG